MTAPNVLVTGASGMIGEALVFRLLSDQIYSPIAAARSATQFDQLCSVVSFDLTPLAILPSLADVQVVIHAAARVHVMNDTSSNILDAYQLVNVEGTARLARHAAQQGVKRFIFISSVKVNGERTARGKPFTADDIPAPVDPYGKSKYEAEKRLEDIGRDTGMEIVIVRPPLVYGPGVKANFLSMLSLLNKGIPLPLGNINNQRSLVSIDNLVDLIITCIDHPSAANNIFLVSDGEDVSTTNLLQLLASAMGRKACLIPFPKTLLNLLGVILGKKLVTQRICESLQVDINKNRELLGWSPPFRMKKMLSKTVFHYLEMQDK